MFRHPLRVLPAGYHEVEFLDVTDLSRLIWLNVMAVVPLLVSAVIVVGWWLLTVPLRAGLTGDGVPWWQVIVGLLGLLAVHEGLHGVTMLALGHRPTFGAKLSQGLLYALSEGAYYRRSEFLIIALAPLTLISLAGLALMPRVADSPAFWLGLAVVVNAASAIGDLWMSARALRYPPSVLIRDEPTGVRFFMPVSQVERQTNAP